MAHIKEAGFDTPPEPVIFMKAPDSITGPNDDVVIPPNSAATDYEVELAIVIGKSALYLKSPEDSPEHILGYSISQDVSERHWQMGNGLRASHFQPLIQLAQLLFQQIQLMLITCAYGVR